MAKVLSKVLDFLVFLSLGLWLLGTLHGADARRIALVLVLIGFSFFSEASLWVLGIKRIWKKLDHVKTRRILLGCIFALWAIRGIAQSLAIRFPVFDFGIFHQLMTSLAYGRGFFAPISQAPFFLSDHFVISMALLTPLYRLTHEAIWTLPIIHAGLFSLAVWAWMKIAESRIDGTESIRTLLSKTVLLVGILFESHWANLTWGFHENAIAYASFSWMVYFALGRTGFHRSGLFNLIGTLLCLLIGTQSKENLLLTGAIAAVILLWKSQRIFGIGIALLLGLEFFWFQKLPHPEGKNYFIRYYGYLGSNFTEMVTSLATRPWSAIQTVGLGNMLGYGWAVLFPFLLGLPFVSKKGRKLLWIVIPSFASALLSTYAPLRETGFHYITELWPWLMMATLFGLGHIAMSKSSGVAKRWCVLWILMAAWGLRTEPVRTIFSDFALALERKDLKLAMDAIPYESRVLVDDQIGSWISGRPNVERWQDKPFSKDHQIWIVSSSLDIASHSMGMERIRAWDHSGFSGWIVAPKTDPAHTQKDGAP